MARDPPACLRDPRFKAPRLPIDAKDCKLAWQADQPHEIIDILDSWLADTIDFAHCKEFSLYADLGFGINLSLLNGYAVQDLETTFL